MSLRGHCLRHLDTSSTTFSLVWILLLLEHQPSHLKLEIQNPKMLCCIPWASSIQSLQEHSGWRRARSLWRGSLGPQTGPPSADIPASAPQTTSHPTVCSRPCSSPCRTKWTGEASSSGKSLSEWRRRRRPEVVCDGATRLLCVWCRDKPVGSVGLEGTHPPERNWFVLPWREPRPCRLPLFLSLVSYLALSLFGFGLQETVKTHSWWFGNRSIKQLEEVSSFKAASLSRKSLVHFKDRTCIYWSGRLHSKKKGLNLSVWSLSVVISKVHLLKYNVEELVLWVFPFHATLYL